MELTYTATVSAEWEKTSGTSSWTRRTRPIADQPITLGVGRDARRRPYISDDWPRLLLEARKAALTVYPGNIGQVLADQFASAYDGIVSGEPVWWERHAARCRAACDVLAQLPPQVLRAKDRAEQARVYRDIGDGVRARSRRDATHVDSSGCASPHR